MRGENQAAWLNRMLQRTRPATAFIRLEHLKADNQTGLIETVAVPKKISATFAAEVCEQYSDLALDACDILYGEQFFAIVCHDSAARDVGRKTWRMKGALEEDAGSTLVPNDAGFKAQLMQQNRFLFEHTFKMSQTLFAAMADENMRLRAVEQEYHNKRMAMFETQEELKDGQHERALELATLEGRFKKQERLFSLLERTFGGKLRAAVASASEGVSAAASASGATVEAASTGDPFRDFLNELSDDQRAKMYAILTDEQKRLLAFGQNDKFFSSLTDGQQMTLIDMLTPEQQEKLSKIHAGM